MDVRELWEGDWGVGGGGQAGWKGTQLCTNLKVNQLSNKQDGVI